MIVTVNFDRVATVECKVHNDDVRRESDSRRTASLWTLYSTFATHGKKVADTAVTDGSY